MDNQELKLSLQRTTSKFSSLKIIDKVVRIWRLKKAAYQALYPRMTQSQLACTKWKTNKEKGSQQMGSCLRRDLGGVVLSVFLLFCVVLMNAVKCLSEQACHQTVTFSVTLNHQYTMRRFRLPQSFPTFFMVIKPVYPKKLYLFFCSLELTHQNLTNKTTLKYKKTCVFFFSTQIKYLSV